METQKIKIGSDFKLPDIISDVEKGRLRIPNFQRRFIWEKSKVIKLLESIYQEFPIGSFFFWQAPRKYFHFYRDIAELGLPKPSRYDSLSFILDGQQRITSLYVTVMGLELFGKDYGNICFDLDSALDNEDPEAKHFTDRRPDNERYVSLKELLTRDIPEFYDGLSVERKRAFNDCRQRFYTYPFSVVYVRDKELDEVCEIFERLNQGGTRLSLFDLISAGTWSTAFDLRKEVENENEKYIQKGFGKLDNEVYTQALALIAKHSCTRSSQLQLRNEDIENHWRNTLKAIGLTIDYFKNNLGVVNYSFLPYRGLVALAAYLFYKNKLKSLKKAQSEKLEEWFWKSSFSERYSRSTLTLMTEDAKLMDRIIEGRKANVFFPVKIDIETLVNIRMYRKSAIKNGVLCLLALKKPRHFKNNSLLPLGEEYYSDFNSYEKHHIFPRSIIEKKFPLTQIHSLPNFCFLPSELNREISNKKPSQYFKKYDKENPDFKDALKTHFVEYNEAVNRNDYVSFLGSRASLLLDGITRITGSQAIKLAEDSAAKAISKLEIKLRDYLDDKLLKHDENYWKTKIPADIKTRNKERYQSLFKKDPSMKKGKISNRNMLDYCDFMDYPKIILTNWDFFYPDFRSKYEVEKKFVNLKEFRHSIAHSKEIAPFMKREGEAAIEWLDIILSKKQKHAIRPEDDTSYYQYTGKKIKSFTLFGEKHEVKYWIEMLGEIAGILYKKHKKDFDKVLTLRGRSRPYFTMKKEELRSPWKLEGTDIFMEANIGAGLIVGICHDLISLFEDDYKLEIETQ